MSDTNESPHATKPFDIEGMPPGIPYIIGNEAAERFSFYGMRTILTIFMTDFLLKADGTEDFMTNTEAVGVFHLFVTAVYFTPILGAFVSDALFGKYKTIISLSIVYCLGHLALALDETRLGLTIGLTLIAIGSGGIKPCVSAHVGDQFGNRNKHLISKVFSGFYFSINVGAFLSTLLTPVLLNRFGPHVAFGVPGALMLIATWVFWLGRRKFVHIPAQGTRAVKEAMSPEGRKAIGSLLLLFLFVSMFWSLFDQTGSAWILQAKRMDLNWMGHEWLPSQIGAANPLLILILIPIFGLFLYPAIDKVFPLTPLRKVGIGMFVTVAAFCVPALIDTQITGGSIESKKSEAQEFDLSLFPDRSKWAAERLIDGEIDGTGWCSVGKETYAKNRKDKPEKEWGNDDKMLPQEIVIRLRERRTWSISEVRFYAATDLTRFLLQEDQRELSRLTADKRETFAGFKPDSPELIEAARSCWAKEIEIYTGESRQGDPIAPKEGQPQWEWKRALGKINLEQTEEFQSVTFDPVETEYLMIRITSNWGGKYVSLGEVQVIADQTEPPTDGAYEHAGEVWPNVAAIGYKPKIVWQLLAYVLLTCAEVMVSITFLEFSYTQAPKNMKSIMMSLYLMTVSIGNLFTSLVNFFIGNPDGSSQLEGAAYYWFFTIVMAVTSVLFVIASQFYKGKTYIQGDDETELSVLESEADAEGIAG